MFRIITVNKSLVMKYRPGLMLRL